MPELTPQERLQPALLDRLTDERPDRRTEPASARVIDAHRLRRAVLRDLSWLFNSTRLASRDVAALNAAAIHSVVNFGLPPFAGELASTLDTTELEAAVRQAIVDFEPRIEPESLTVSAITQQLAIDHHNVVSVEIRGRLWAHPVPLELLLRTDLDLETGEVRIRELGGSSFA
jgi:type VI secretion system protein ImpF